MFSPSAAEEVSPQPANKVQIMTHSRRIDSNFFIFRSPFPFILTPSPRRQGRSTAGNPATGHEVAGTDFYKGRILLAAGFLAMRASYGKAAAWRWINGACNLSTDYLKVVLPVVQFRYGNGRQQHLGIGMEGIGKQLREEQRSMHWPRYITAISSEMCFTTLRSWVMNI